MFLTMLAERTGGISALGGCVEKQDATSRYKKLITDDGIFSSGVPEHYNTAYEHLPFVLGEWVIISVSVLYGQVEQGDALSIKGWARFREKTREDLGKHGFW
jgi:hypothetical protein